MDVSSRFMEIVRTLNLLYHANDLLKEIDNRYCRYQETDGQFFYEYDNRNRSTSHVHMLLNGALAKMINKTECLFFVNTPNSVNAQDAENPSKTASPWIYSELLMTCILHIRIRRHERLK